MFAPKVVRSPATLDIRSRPESTSTGEEDRTVPQTRSDRPATRQAPHVEAPPLVHQIRSSPGQPLAAPDLNFFQSGFGFDFSRVRIHTDRTAAASAHAVNARAYASGSNIAFATGQYQPGTQAGRGLIAHELAHVVQQSGSPPANSTLQISSPSDPAEMAADAAAMLVMQGGKPRSRGVQPRAVYRQVQASPADAEKARVAALEAAYRTALASSDKDKWQKAAEYLNAFNVDDILARLASLSEGQMLSLENGAWKNPRVGPKSNVAEIIHGVVSAIDPAAYSSGAVFPNNFGDKLGPVGGVVVAAAGGLLALRLALPLLAGYWRQIQITIGMTKIASEVDKEDAQLAEQEIGVVVDRLINSGGSQRVLVTYQSMTPALDRELYVTSQEGAQYAEAVAQGRNLYMLRIPERLFQLLQQRQLIEVRQGSMGSQVGDDIRIAAGAMQFLSKYFKEVPLK